MIPSTPIDTAHALFNALSRADWDAAAQLADLESVATWHQTQIALLADEVESSAEAAPSPGSGSLRQIQMDVATTADRLARHGSTLFPELFGTTTLAELATSSPTRFFSRYLAATAPLRAASGPPADPHVIGELFEGDTAYVLYRWGGLGWPRQTRELSVLTLRRVSEGWRYLIDQLSGPPVSHLARSAHQ